MVRKHIFSFASIAIVFILTGLYTQSAAQLLVTKQQYSKQDTLRGSIGEGRKGWDVLHYDISITPSFESKTLEGKNTIRFIDSGVHFIQIDLQEPMLLDGVKLADRTLNFRREGNVYWLKVNDSNKAIVSSHVIRTITCWFHGKPTEAIKPPWDGGWIWKTDSLGRPWMSVACQGIGASTWFPCKDHQSDEPDSGAILRITVPDSLTAVANGRRIEYKKIAPGTSTYVWEVKNPINNYNIVPYIGKYVHFSEQYPGLKGKLDMDYLVLDYNLSRAKKQFTDARRMMKAFEYWLGPYPFYEDGYKLVESPHLGMEHQSAIAYGNGFTNGYKGVDKWTGTGLGLLWDFIIIHESGHEWFANSITTNDVADLWIHESFTTYSEILFMEYYFGIKTGEQYLIASRKNIKNNKPIIGTYGVNDDSGTLDCYYKGSSMIHNIRQLIGNDTKFRNLLKGLTGTFKNKTVTSDQIEKYISNKTGINLSVFFDQYLRTIQIPVLEYRLTKNSVQFRYTNCLQAFQMPVKVRLAKGKRERWIKPQTTWTSLVKGKNVDGISFDVNPNFYILTKKVN